MFSQQQRCPPSQICLIKWQLTGAFTGDRQSDTRANFNLARSHVIKQTDSVKNRRQLVITVRAFGADTELEVDLRRHPNRHSRAHALLPFHGFRLSVACGLGTLAEGIG